MRSLPYVFSCLATQIRDMAQDLRKVFVPYAFPSLCPFPSSTFPPASLCVSVAESHLSVILPKEGCKLSVVSVASGSLWPHLEMCRNPLSAEMMVLGSRGPQTIKAVGPREQTAWKRAGVGRVPELRAYPCSWLVHRPEPRVTEESFLSFRSELRHRHHRSASSTLPRF